MVTIFFVLYPFGTAFILLRYLLSYRWYLLKLRRNRTLTDIPSPVRVYKSATAVTPMLIGVFRTCVVLPLCEYTDEQLRNVMAHELTHYKRRDIWVKWFSVIAVSLHWFNPFAWLMRREIDRLCELSCDEAVISRYGTDEKQSYGDTLIAVVAERKLSKTVLSTTMVESKQALKERLGAIMKHMKRTKLTLIVSAVLIIAAVGTAVALGAGSSTKNAPDNTFANKELGITIVFPSQWNGLYEIVLGNDGAWENFPRGTEVYTVPRPNDTLLSGWVGSFIRFGREELDSLRANEQWENEVFGNIPKTIIYENDENIVLFITPNDVQFDNETSDIYKMISDGINNGECEISLEQPLYVDETPTPSSPTAQAPEREIINMGAEYNVLNEMVPVPGEVKFASMFNELLADNDNDDKLFAIQIRVFAHSGETGTIQDERARLTSLGFDIGVADHVLVGLVPGAKLRDFPVNADCGYEITWDTRDVLSSAGLPTQPLSPYGGEWVQYITGLTSKTEGYFIGSTGPALGHQENYVYLTHDGGKTWTETGNVNAEWARVLTCGVFANEKVGFLCFRYDIENIGRIYRTDDGGESWELLDLWSFYPLKPHSETFSEVRSMVFEDNGVGILGFFIKLSESDAGSTEQMITDDYGATWGTLPAVNE
jgi:hypothetical protein